MKIIMQNFGFLLERSAGNGKIHHWIPELYRRSVDAKTRLDNDYACITNDDDYTKNTYFHFLWEYGPCQISTPSRPLIIFTKKKPEIEDFEETKRRFLKVRSILRNVESKTGLGF